MGLTIFSLPPCDSWLPDQPIAENNSCHVAGREVFHKPPYPEVLDYSFLLEGCKTITVDGHDCSQGTFLVLTIHCHEYKYDVVVFSAGISPGLCTVMQILIYQSSKSCVNLNDTFFLLFQLLAVQDVCLQQFCIYK